MSFATYFKGASYAMVVVAMLALVFAGGLDLGLAGLFAAVVVLAWTIEGKKWQLSERTGLVIVLLSIPLFFLDWQYQKGIGDGEKLGVDALAHLIVFLAAIKLLQVKSDRDWVFLYLISFFEVLLAAGLSFSPIFLATLSLYLLCGLSTIITFEIRKARRGINLAETRLLIPPDSSIFRRLARTRPRRNIEANRLPFVSVGILFLIFIFALPLFLVAPRGGSAMISRGGAGLSNFIGFSENVSLGALGELKQNNEVVMRVRIEDPQTRPEHELKWRGIALDEFSGRSWRKSAQARRSEEKTSDHGFFQLGTTEGLHRLTTQTYFLEPIDSAVLFAAPRAVAIQADLPLVRVDAEDAIQTRRHDSQRIIYKVFSDFTEPDVESLRKDMRPYPAPFGRYLQLPEPFDSRITDLASAILSSANAHNRYDAARAIETRLRNDYGYSLQMKATGSDPLADFLFNVRAGHCEYFSTAMAVMLRTHGVAARVVNGFLPGQYNEASGAFTVRQSDAHSWVEVYFPATNSWVTFDPTPAAGRAEPMRNGLAGQVAKYLEAFELMWFQYVVGYDKQEQHSLATSLHDRAFRSQHVIALGVNELKRIISLLWHGHMLAISGVILLILAMLLLLRINGTGWRGFRISRRREDSQRSAIEFYERLTRLLARRGLKRSPDQTPLEFAAGAGLNEVLAITSAYNRVRYGDGRLSRLEQKQIEEMLLRLERSSVATPISL